MNKKYILYRDLAAQKGKKMRDLIEYIVIVEGPPVPLSPRILLLLMKQKIYLKSTL